MNFSISRGGKLIQKLKSTSFVQIGTHTLVWNYYFTQFTRIHTNPEIMEKVKCIREKDKYVDKKIIFV